MNQRPTYSLDIETDTSGGFGLDPRFGGVASVALWSADEAVVFDSTCEASMLADLAAWLTNPYREAGVIATWNGAAFDMPFLKTRADMLGVDTLSTILRLELSDLRPIKYEPIGGHDGAYLIGVGRHDHVDVMRAWQPWAKEQGISAGLKSVAAANNIECVVVDREQIHQLTRQELVAYNLSDVAATYELAELAGDDLTRWLDSRSLLAAA